jgi:hypothetical protein
VTDAGSHAAIALSAWAYHRVLKLARTIAEATRLLAESGDRQRFADARAWTAYAGLTPRSIARAAVCRADTALESRECRSACGAVFSCHRGETT